MSIGNFVRKIVLRERYDSNTYIKYLRKAGVRIGEHTTIYRPMKTYIDMTRPYMIEIGKMVKITEGVTILTHGFDWSVINGLYGDILGSAGKVTIGDNVFIGMKATILKGVTIGNNCIIGANSLVNHDVPSNSVVGGVPARVLCTIDEYAERQRENQENEAKQMAVEYQKVYKKRPPLEEFSEFFWLFDEEKNEKFSSGIFDEMMNLNGNKEKAYKLYHTRTRKFSDYQSFLNWCYKE